MASEVDDNVGTVPFCEFFDALLDGFRGEVCINGFGSGKLAGGLEAREVAIDSDDLFCAEGVCHGAGGEAEKARTDDGYAFVLNGAGVTENSGDSGGGAIGRRPNSVRKVGRNGEDGGACGKETVFG